MATAALAAQPPLTTKKPLACTFPSGGGKRFDAKYLIEHDDAGAQDRGAAPALALSELNLSSTQARMM